MDGLPRFVSVVLVKEGSRSSFQAGAVSEIRAVAAEAGLVYLVYLHALFGDVAVGPIQIALASGSRSEGPVAEPVVFFQQHDQHLGSPGADRRQRVPGGRSGVVHRYPGGRYPAGCVAVDRRGSQSGQRFGAGAAGPPHDVHPVVVLPEQPALVGLAAVGVRPAEGVAYLVGQHRRILHGRGVDQHRPPVARKTPIGSRTAAEPPHPQQPAVVRRVEDDYHRPVHLGLVTLVAAVHRETAALVVVDGRADADRPACGEHRPVLPARRPIEPGPHPFCELGRIAGRAAPVARRRVAYPHFPAVAFGSRKRIGAPEPGMGDQLQRVARIDAVRVGRQRTAGGGGRGFRRGFRPGRFFGRRRLLGGRIFGGRILGGRIQRDGSVRLHAGVAQGPDDERGHLTPGYGAVGIVGAVRPSARHAQLVHGVDRPFLGGGNHVDDVGERIVYRNRPAVAGDGHPAVDGFDRHPDRGGIHRGQLQQPQQEQRHIGSGYHLVGREGGRRGARHQPEIGGGVDRGPGGGALAGDVVEALLWRVPRACPRPGGRPGHEERHLPPGHLPVGGKEAAVPRPQGDLVIGDASDVGGVGVVIRYVLEPEGRLLRRRLLVGAGRVGAGGQRGVGRVGRRPGGQGRNEYGGGRRQQRRGRLPFRVHGAEIPLQYGAGSNAGTNVPCG